MRRLRALLDVEILSFESYSVQQDGKTEHAYLKLSSMGVQAEALGKSGWAALKQLRGELPSQLRHVLYTLLAVSTLGFVLTVGCSGPH
ncbi:hypothetical protein ACIRPT_02500 [Streptomyces sp. NPDC101227]|uniref:hypothetical protein n=1 Tax=Streptomyces sp. NPDC101227 TaxID=3366136 RepID=UPI00381D2F5C